MEKRQSIQVDISCFRNYVDTLFFKQNDTNVYPVEIDILKEGDPFDLSDVTHISFINETPISRSVVEGPCEIKDAMLGKTERLFGTNEISEYGEAKAEIKLFSGDKLLTSATFSYFIERTLYTDESIESTIEYTSLQQALKEVDVFFEDAEKKMDDALEDAAARTDEVISKTEQRVEKIITLFPDIVQRTWTPQTTVKKGQIVYPTDISSPLAFECVVAGTTGTTEPTGIKHQLVTDGSVKWGIFDVRLGRPEITGDTIFMNRYPSVPGVGYRIQNGITLINLSTNYPPLYEALQKDTVPQMSMAVWTTRSTEYNNGIGGVPYFGYDGGDTCIIPDMRDMTLKAQGTMVLRGYHADAIQNIKAGWSDTDSYCGTKHPTGAMNITAGASSTWTMMSQNTRNSTVYDIDASRTVRTATETRVKSVMQMPGMFTGYEEVVL